MKQRRGVFTLVVLVVCASSMMLFAQSKDDKKKDDAQKKEIQNIVKTVDDLAAGQPAANDLSLTWLREDVLKAQGNKEYAPFAITVDPTKATGGTISFYWRVVSKNAPAGSDVAVAAVKSMLAAANSAYDNLTKVAKQATEIAEANVSAATETVKGFAKAKKAA